MSNATNSGERMSTRGDAKEKMSKVMAIVRSGGLEEDSRQENSKAVKKSGKASTGKASTGKASTSKASKKVPVSKLAELEDASLRKAEAARSSHPRRLTDEVLSARPIHKVAQNELGSSSDTTDDDDDDKSDKPPPKASGTKAAGKKKKESKQAKFETPDAKKNINTTVVTWVHEFHRPTQPPPKKQKSVSAKPSIVISKVSTKAKTTSGKSASCAIVSTSTTNGPRRSRCAEPNVVHEELESSSDSESDGEVEGGLLEGWTTNYDDAMEQAAAALEPHEGISCRTRNKRPTQTTEAEEARQWRTPNGALDSGSGLAGFIPDFFSGTLAGMEKASSWAFKRRDTVHVFTTDRFGTSFTQEVPIGACQNSHSRLVEIGGPVHQKVVREFTHPSPLKYTNLFLGRPASHRVAQNAVGSTGLSVVGDFMDSTGLDTTEARREAAEQLLSNERYIYLKTKDVVEDGMATVKRAGRYRGPLVTHTLAQCWIDFEGSVEVPGYVDDDDFPYAALVLCATSVHRALWLWANGYISKESYDAGLAQKKNGILKALGPDGKFTKTTNFSKEQWEEISDIHTRDVWSVEPEKLQVVRADIDTAVNRIRNRKPTKRRVRREADQLVKKSRGLGDEYRIASSDSNFWFVLFFWLRLF
ncbi:hypothetical protein EDB84DRAFT_1439057 [Lactarius hengduanensis]|nr:hypothetical protein EDB84DRAFT_1439057 [Lactarius hengduanensis]